MANAHLTPLSSGKCDLVGYEQLKPGKVIRQEEPQVSIELPIPLSDWSDAIERRFYQSEYNNSDKWVRRQLSKLSAEKIELFRGLPTTRKYHLLFKQDISRFEDNPWLVKGGSVDG
jgi:hypothetical protein